MMGRDATDPSDRKLRTRQQITSQRILLNDADASLDGRVRCSQSSSFVGMDNSLQFNQISNIAVRSCMFPNRVAALGQRRCSCHTIGVRSHADNQRTIGIVDVKLYTRDGRPGHTVRLGQPQATSHRLVLYHNLNGLQIVLGDHHIGSETAIEETSRSSGFFDAVGAVGQQRRFGNTIGVRGDRGDNLTVPCTMMGRDAADPGDAKLCTRQEITGYSILLHDADASLDGIIGDIQVRGLIGNHFSRQFCQCSHITSGIPMFPNNVTTLAQRRNRCHTTGVRSHTCNQRPSRIVDAELNACDRRTSHTVRLGQPDAALHGAVLDSDRIGPAILFGIDRRGETTVDIAVGGLYLADCVASIGQPICDGSAICARGDDNHSISSIICDTEHCARQHITSHSISLDDLDPAGNRHVGGSQVRHSIGLDVSGQLDQIAGVAGRQRMFLDRVLTTGQVRRHCYAIFVGGHAADQRTIGIIDVELNTGNRFARVRVCFGQPNAALYGDVLNTDGVGLSMLSYIDDGAESAVDIATCRLRFSHGIRPIREPVAFRSAVCAGDQRSHNRAIGICHLENSACQHSLRISISLDNPDLTVYNTVYDFNGQEQIVFREGQRIKPVIAVVAFGRGNLLHRVIPQGKVSPSYDAIAIRHDRRSDRITCGIVQLKYRTRQGYACC